MAWHPLRKQRERDLIAADGWRVARRVAQDEVTVLGEDLAELHLDTLNDRLNDQAAHHYGRALEHYDQAKAAVAASASAEDLLGVEQLIGDARYHRAAVLAVLAGDPLPERRGPCFFDPRHGPSVRDVEWAPPSGVARTVAVCAADGRRLAGGEAPAIRQVRVGDRYMPVHEVGSMAGIVETSRAYAASHGAGSRAAAEAHTRAGLRGGMDGGGDVT